MSAEPDALAVVNQLRDLAADPMNRRAIVQDQGCLPGLILFLDHANPQVVYSALLAIRYLAECRANQEKLKGQLGMMLSLHNVVQKSTTPGETKLLASEIYELLQASSSTEAEPAEEMVSSRRKAQFFLGSSNKRAKTVILHIDGLDDSVALEMIKVVGAYEFDSFKNCFFNLAIPVVVLTEPAPVKRTLIRDNIYFSIWDCWTIFGHEDFTLSDFINAVREKYGIEPTMVVHGVKMLYVPVMPGHSKRLKLTMQKLIRPSVDRRYVDLTVSFAPEADGDDDLPGPPVRYYFSRHGEMP